jgi:type IV pilus assembly protein PilV
VPTAAKNSDGYSLVEVMIALVVLLLVFLALMHTTVLSIDANMRNILRDEGVSIADRQMIAARNTAYVSLADGWTNGSLQGDLRNYTSTYFWWRQVSPLGSANEGKQVVIWVRWDWKGVSYWHKTSSIIRNPNP